MIHAIRDFSSSFSLLFTSYSFIRQHALGKYLTLPILASLFSLALVGFAAYLGISTLVDGLGHWLSGEQSLWQEGGIVSFFIGVFVWIASGVFVVFIYSLVVPIVVIPFMGPLLEQLELILLGQTITISVREDFSNAFYAMATGLRHGLYSLLILVASVFTGPLQIPLNIFAQSYFLGRASFDYIFEKIIFNKDVFHKKMKNMPSNMAIDHKNLLVHSRYAILGNGCAHLAFLLVPILGAIFAPIFSLVAAVRWSYDSYSD